MIKTNAMLLADTYKFCHILQYNPGLTKLYSYWTPRKSMLKTCDKMVFFGLQAFIQEFLVDYFKENFFDREINEVIAEYEKYMKVQLPGGGYATTNIIDLHRLGYLPLQIRAIPEGTSVSMGIPCIEVTNTHDNFAWLVQWVECILQAELWKTCNHATISKMYFELAKEYYDKTVDGGDPRMAMSDFGMRGMSCTNESIRCSAAWLTCFNKTSTVPALPYIDKFYDADVTHTKIGMGAVSTEHSVMASNYAIDGDEVTFIKRMLTEIYPNTSFSMVSDTYDYWNLVDNIIPSLKSEILQHNGTLLIRPDSGDQFEVVTKTLEKLWVTFGGYANEKGYRVLNSHIRTILGDGCTLFTVRRIWEWMEENEFAANNVYFGVGAFCFTGIFDNEKLIVNTRDTFGVAEKACAGITNGKFHFIYKDPKTDTGNLKKSHKGIVWVQTDSEGNLYETDEHDTMLNENASALKTVFKDGVMLNKQTFSEIRARIAGTNLEFARR